MKKLLFLMLVLCSMVFSGCYRKADDFAQQLDSTLPGNFTVVKHHGVKLFTNYHYAVFAYNSGGTTTFVAVNLKTFDIGDNALTYLTTLGPNDTEQVTSVGWGFYRGNNTGWLYEETQLNSKDLEKAQALLNDAKVLTMGKGMAEKFALTQKRGIELAHLLTQWNSIKERRSITRRDANAFSNEVLGFNLIEAEEAYSKYLDGDESHLNDLFSTAAEINNTTPENINKIFNEYLNN